ncbi:DoxX family protein [Olivibacter sp. CPCC 100613]|uniref:DoxX family protein n=1 Tax=Olivibacter sp. CPCC 100613 TaxID=3079931 RepID=UPI002FF7BA2E
MEIKNIILWGIKLLAAIIMLQTLFFKFTAAPESVYLFTKIGMEPWGRIGVGILEIFASLLILIPRTTAFGALLGLGLMSGALFFHFTILGVVVQGDSGRLFIYALLVFFSCIILLIAFKSQLLQLYQTKFRSH